MNDKTEGALVGRLRMRHPCGKHSNMPCDRCESADTIERQARELEEALAQLAAVVNGTMTVVQTTTIEPASHEPLLVLETCKAVPELRPTNYSPVHGAMSEAWQALADTQGEGMVLVPSEPTEAMLKAGREECDHDGWVPAIYRAMIAASNEPTQVGGHEAYDYE